MNNDLIRARNTLVHSNFTCVLCRGDTVRTCTARGVRPLLELLEEGSWQGFSAADKVVGKATAFLYVLLGVKAVWAPVISESALEVLTSHGIEAFWDATVPSIFNRDRTGFCPMETATRDIEDPAEALAAIRKTLAILRRQNAPLELTPYAGDSEQAVFLIRQFWKAHNGAEPSPEDAREDLALWTGEGHRFYFIRRGDEVLGFLHLGSRGCAADWLEDLFVLPQHQNQGIGTQAIRLAEEIVSQYSDSLYIEAATRNQRAIRLYRKLGYDCLNTITVRKDFRPEQYETPHTESLLGEEFQIKTIRQP